VTIQPPLEQNSSSGNQNNQKKQMQKTKELHHSDAVFDETPSVATYSRGTNSSAVIPLSPDGLRQVHETGPVEEMPSSKLPFGQQIDQAVLAEIGSTMRLCTVSGAPGCLKIVPLPPQGKAQNHTRCAVVGATGNGKTVFINKLLGCKRVNDRILASSSSRTTTARTTVTIDRGNYEFFLKFVSREKVEFLVQECVEQAFIKALEGYSDDHVMNRLLSHDDQKFRLYYILGPWLSTEHDEDQDVVGNKKNANRSDVSDLAPSLRKASLKQHKMLLEGIRELARMVKLQLETDLSLHQNQCIIGFDDDCQDAACVMMRENKLFSQLVSSILDLVSQRFSNIKEGFISHDDNGWPSEWIFSTTKRRLFVKTLRLFTGNHFRYHGKLLSPIVEEIRLMGPFYDDCNALNNHQLVIFDSVGIGHSFDSSPGDFTQILSTASEVDFIVLVDSARQPMMQPVQDLLESLANNGHLEKVIIAYTQMDTLNDPSYRSFRQKRQFVFDSLQGAVESLSQKEGANLMRDFARSMEDRTFFFGNLHKPMKDDLNAHVPEMQKLLQIIQAPQRSRGIVSNTSPVYSVNKLQDLIEKSATELIRSWELRLGVEKIDGIPKIHWMTIKALSRRLANTDEEVYKNLSPAGDLSNGLMSGISKWLDKPIIWDTNSFNRNELQDSLNAVRRRISPRILQLSRIRLILNQRVHWQYALDQKGQGSSARRASQILSIFHRASPSVLSPEKGGVGAFCNEVIRIVEDEISRIGGSLSAGGFSSDLGKVNTESVISSFDPNFKRSGAVRGCQSNLQKSYGDVRHEEDGEQSNLLRCSGSGRLP
jgi:signal recognition particle receptor subunit beta